MIADTESLREGLQAPWWIVASLLLSGCVSLENVPPYSLPARLDHDGEPPMPPGADIDGSRRIGRCFKDAALIFAGVDRTFDVPADAAFAELHADAWTNATLAVVASAAGSPPLALNATPFVDRSNATTRLGYAVEQGDRGADFISGMVYGRWYPWSVGLVVDSNSEALRGVGLNSSLSGWILVAAGGKPGQSDDRIHAYLDRSRLDEDPFHRIPLTGGDLFLFGRGVCAD